MPGEPIAATDSLKKLMEQAKGAIVPPSAPPERGEAAPPPPAQDGPQGDPGGNGPYRPSETIPMRTHVVFFLCAFMVVSFGVWSVVSEIDIVSMAMGEVIPSTQVKTIQHLEGGIVRQIKVVEGAKVKAGQELVVLEPTASSADVGELGERLVSLRFDLARLSTLLTGEETLTLDPELAQSRPDLADAARQRFQADLENHLSNIKRQNAAIVQRSQEIQEIRTRIVNSGKSLKLVDEQVKISEGLLKRDLTNRFVHLNLLKEAEQLRGGIENDKASLKRAEAARKEAQAVLESIQSEFTKETQRLMGEAELNFRELTQRIQKFRDNLQRTVVRSPVDGTVKTLHVVTVGGVIRPGDPVVDIVPAGDKLIIEAKLPTQDIGYVVSGQSAMVKLASGDAMRFGALKGTVIHVSPDTLQTPDGNPYYKVRIATESDHFSRGSLVYNLFPGMQVMASIQTGSRTVLRYLVDPLLANLDDALGER
ncbi:MAG: HlyD family type I secretion periplasmic adaptor subunit [Rhodospirillales bacterium CG15_BIG_FIL_POST_REV_8_21_14_020_66_15]|nr:MAG: HlyD family type I secretion periplasmic adaptor subunit [Rhodospirillales bacterium CG15_BIG_FIL_POST_REV_8_21_14_020_66_15]